MPRAARLTPPQSRAKRTSTATPERLLLHLGTSDSFRFVRGALALIQNEAELAGVLGHEITHVTGKHAINAIKKSKVAGGVAENNAWITVTRRAA